MGKGAGWQRRMVYERGWRFETHGGPEACLTVREARIEDSAVLAQIQVGSYRTAYAGIFPQAYLDRFTVEEQAQDWRTLLSLELEDVLLVAETEAGEVVGYALGRPGLTGL